MPTSTERIKRRALEMGFTHVGVAAALPLDAEADHLREWLERGYQGTMHWMKRSAEKRGNPLLVLPGARSVIALAVNYYTPDQHADAPETGKISRYAWGGDYHDLLGKRLEAFRDWLTGEFPGSETRLYVDTGPVMEKAWAARAGIGWEGKHTNVITRDRGSWVFLGEVLTTLELDPDPPAVDRCGSCTLCIDACPTEAIVAPYVLDSNRCISYLTIEHRGPFDEVLAERTEGWIYGCDVCQDVCPWNRKFSVAADEPEFAAREGFVAPVLEEWSEMTEEEFRGRFKGSPMKRTKRDGLLRNVRIALDAVRSRRVPD